jgi:hypothetical protein
MYKIWQMETSHGWKYNRGHELFAVLQIQQKNTQNIHTYCFSTQQRSRDRSEMLRYTYIEPLRLTIICFLIETPFLTLTADPICSAQLHGPNTRI